MGTYASIRGWLGSDERPLAEIRRIVTSDEYANPRYERYAAGWSIPAAPVNSRHPDV
ncbi:hypothetical protein [Saccharothrix hoggarensis]|uniref:Uncharacterized protein n=1 Tax=Saccharothrix hoggarensis TaxID=913853 RepID=A0ABW3QWG8_9PSEU